MTTSFKFRFIQWLNDVSMNWLIQNTTNDWFAEKPYGNLYVTVQGPKRTNALGENDHLNVTARSSRTCLDPMSDYTVIFTALELVSAARRGEVGIEPYMMWKHLVGTDFWKYESYAEQVRKHRHG